MQIPPAPTVAIVGRPNVGKSTLFNLLSTGEKALVHATSGTTRDARRVEASLFGLTFDLFDTAGVEEGGKELAGELNELALRAAKAADILIFMVDGREGLTHSDRSLAQVVRKLSKPTVLVANKGDVAASADNLPDFVRLGFGEPVLVSAAHSRGLEELHAALCEHIAMPEVEEVVVEDAVEEPPADEMEAEEAPAGPIKLAVVGRPNVGKSTFVNALLREEKMLAGPVAGLTREAIGHPFTYKERDFVLVDTPGLRKKARVVEDLEGMSVGQSITAIRQADVVVLMVDASGHSIDGGKWQVVEQQDAKIADVIAHEAKTLVVALNKWDLVEDKQACLEDVAYQLKGMLHTIHAPKVVTMSAVRGKGVENVLAAALELTEASRTRLSTGRLNRILEAMIARRPPPLAKGRVVKLKYMTQVRTDPPMFAIWGNRVDTVPNSYKQYLRNQLVEATGLSALPVRIVFKSSANPYKEKRT